MSEPLPITQLIPNTKSLHNHPINYHHHPHPPHPPRVPHLVAGIGAPGCWGFKLGSLLLSILADDLCYVLQMCGCLGLCG